MFQEILDMVWNQKVGWTCFTAAALLWFASIGRAETGVVLADFEQGLGDFNGTIVRDVDVAHDGKASARIDGNFTKPGARWVTASLPLELTNQLQALHLWVRTEQADHFSLRLVDATGQNHQLRPVLTPDGQWHRVDITSFTSGVGYQKWGGANDGQFHWPAKRIDIIFEKGYLGGKESGSMWIDQLTADMVGKPHNPIDDLPVRTLANFEDKVTGFKGAIKRDDKVAHGGKASGRIDCDFSKGRWFTATLPLELDREIRQVRFNVKSTTAKGITFRAVDHTGQVFQQRPGFEPDGAWQPIKIASLTAGPGFQKWGGANDGKFHWPAQSIALIVESGAAVDGKRAQLWIDDIEASVGEGRALPDLDLGELAQPGNVFVRGQPVKFNVDTRGDQVEWTVEDFFHRPVASGKSRVDGGRAVIEPKLTDCGYYEVSISARLGDEIIGAAQTTAAVIADNSACVSPDSPFGVMTHFAQNWDVDIMPLIARAGISSIRDELYWQQVEKKPGEYTFANQYQTYMAEAKKLNIAPLIVMTFANKLYDQGLTPYTDAGRSGYANYGQQIVEHFGRDIRWIEVWNEYNGTWCKGPAAEDRPRFYAAMLKSVYQTIKPEHPEVKIIGGAAVLLPLPYFEGIFKHGGLDYMDAVAIHPYRGQPEGVDEEIRDLKALMARYGPVKPIWVTETGHMDKEPGGRHRNAAYLVRMYTLLLSENVEKIYWYLLRDYGSFKTMGLLHDHNSPLGRYAAAPLYPAYANLIHQLHGAKFMRREPTDPRTRVYQFDQNGQPVRVCWATAPAQVALAADGPLTVVDVVGRSYELTPVDGQVFLTLDQTPLYVRGAIKSIEPAAGGAFTLSPVQTLDVLEPAAVRFAAGDKLAGQLVIGDQKTTIKPGENTLRLPMPATAETGEHVYHYQLLHDGRPAGMGAVRVRIADPLSIDAASVTVRGGVMQVTLRNQSPRTSYDVKSIAWQAGQSRQQQAQAVKLPAGHEMVMSLPVSQLQPYAATAAQVSVELADRSAATFNGPVSRNPVIRHSATIDGDLSDWSDVPAIAPAGGVRMAWNPNGLQFAAKTGGGDLRFALAGATGQQAWYEFRAAMVDGQPRVMCMIAPDNRQIGPVKSAEVKITRDGPAMVYELALPWSAIAPLTVDDRVMRVGLLVNDGQQVRQWGEGMYPGHQPSGLPLCELVDTLEADKAAQLEVAMKPIEAEPQVSGRVIADFADDYSNVQGRHNWHYGYYDGTGGGEGDGRSPDGAYTDDDFKPMHYIQTMWGYEWAGDLKYMKIARDAVHPQVSDGRQVWAVRRWRSDVDGAIRISGQLRHIVADKGDGVGLAVLVDGRVVFKRTIGGPGRPQQMDYQVTAQVQAGSRVDVAVTPGEALSTDYDASSMTERIELLK